MKTDQITRSIQVRLFILLLRAFAAVVALILLLTLTVTTVFLSYPARDNPLDRMPTVTSLEIYYRIAGTWDGVEAIIPTQADSPEHGFWQNALLLDSNNKILIYHGTAGAPNVGQLYNAKPGDTFLAIVVDNREIGALIFEQSDLPMRGRETIGFLAPVFILSFFLAILTTLIGLLLMRRVVVPLSEVVAAARAVAAGDLSTRVPVSGPDDLRALSDSFNHMAASLEQNDRERRNLLADVAHELRTPLTVIRGRLEGIVDGIYPSDEKQIIPALEETYLLERLVEDLRLLTLAEARQLHFEPLPVLLSDLANQTINLFTAEAEEKQVSLRLDDRARDAKASVDPQRTEQVIGNLIGNALRYVPAGGEVWLIVEQKDGAVSLSVNDNGPGVPADDLPHLFQRFWRGEKSRSRASGGAGLGLAIAKQLVEAQGGAIEAANLPGGGLQIRIAFPQNQ
jgi:two-component system OmpR family sensor kinase/two-component system sensor histidine kinase BaeS